MTESNDTWSNYSRLVLKELERHNTLIEGLRDDMANMRGDIKLLKFKASLWGGMWGVIGSLTATLVIYLSQHLSVAKAAASVIGGN